MQFLHDACVCVCVIVVAKHGSRDLFNSIWARVSSSLLAKNFKVRGGTQHHPRVVCTWKRRTCVCAARSHVAFPTNKSVSRTVQLRHIKCLSLVRKGSPVKHLTQTNCKRHVDMSFSGLSSGRFWPQCWSSLANCAQSRSVVAS